MAVFQYDAFRKEEILPCNHDLKVILCNKCRWSPQYNIPFVSAVHFYHSNSQVAASTSLCIDFSGSYRVHNSGSDMDALCVGPYFATMADDFFVVLHNMLASRSEVTEIHFDAELCRAQPGAQMMMMMRMVVYLL